MSAQNSLEKYTRAKQAVDAHIQANQVVFDAHQKLIFDLVDVENDLRDDVAEEAKGVSNADFSVIYEPITQEVVDMEALQAYIKAGTVPAAIIQKNQRPPRINIRAVPQV